VGKATSSSSVSLGTPRIFFVNHHHLAAVPPLVSLLHTVNDDEQMLSQALTLSLIIIPSLVSAGLFPPTREVKLIGAKDFRSALHDNRTAIVAFVAPWCGVSVTITDWVDY
jgi:hypothetical protein